MVVKTFTQACVDGEAQPCDIDDWIDAWHSNIGNASGVSLSEYLGFSLIDYALWVTQDMTAEDIIELYKPRPIEDDREDYLYGEEYDYSDY